MKIDGQEWVTDLRRAFQLGQEYWQQADSESYRENRKASETMAKFNEMLEAAAPQPKAEGNFATWFARALPITEMDANAGDKTAAAARGIARSAWCAGIEYADNTPPATEGADHE